MALKQNTEKYLNTFRIDMSLLNDRDGMEWKRSRVRGSNQI